MNTLQSDLPSGFGPHWLVSSTLGKPGHVVTFYSYKGGTGRSMALVNCAGLIAQNLPASAKPILLIDFDLEAPGLHRYLRPFLSSEMDYSSRPGTLELFEALETLVSKQFAPNAAAIAGTDHSLDDLSVAKIVDELDISPFVLKCSLGRIELIKAGRFTDDSYDKRVSGFDWEHLFLRAPALFRCLAEKLARNYSFVFVDARTGLSDTTGICTMLIPESLVMVFTPNSQSLTGIEHLVRRSVDYRTSSSDTRELRVYPLPSRVDNQVEHYRLAWRMGATGHPQFGDVIGYQPLFAHVFGDIFSMGTNGEQRLNEYFDVVQIPHSADYAYGERLCCDNSAIGDNLSIRGAYEQFLPWLVTRAQSWQAPREVILDQQADSLLRESGYEVLPVDETKWDSWFIRLAVLDQPTHPVTTHFALLPAERQVSFKFAVALYLAYRRDFLRSFESLIAVDSAMKCESLPSIPIEAIAALVRTWSNGLAPAEWSNPNLRRWVDQAYKTLQSYPLLKRQQQTWLYTIAEFAYKANWADLACQAYEALCKVQSSNLGAEHLETLASMEKLAEILLSINRPKDARSVLEEVYKSRRHVQGELHPDSLECLRKLARSMLASSNLSDAKQTLELVISGWDQCLASGSSDAVEALKELVEPDQIRLDPQGAKELQRRIVKVIGDHTGKHSLFTLESVRKLAHILKESKDIDGCHELLNELYHLTSKIFGATNKSTIDSRDDLANILLDKGNLFEGKALKEEVLNGKVITLGEGHLETIVCRRELANVYLTSGEFDNALEQLDKAKSASEDLLGKDDQLTASIEAQRRRTLKSRAKLKETSVVGDAYGQSDIPRENKTFSGQSGDLSKARKVCFVVQGFGKKTDYATGRVLDLDASYEVIKNAVESSGLECVRADEIIHSGTIDVPMYEWLLNADLVIVDLSTYNVNAAFQLGVRYALRPYSTIVMAEEQFRNPFDLSHIVIRSYKHLGDDIGKREGDRLAGELKASIQAILPAPKTDSPVYTYLPQLQPPSLISGEVLGPVSLAAPWVKQAALAEIVESDNPSAKLMLDAALDKIAQSDFAAARILLEEVHKIRPTDPYVLQQLALSTYKSKQPGPVAALEAAREVLKELSPETSNNPETLAIWGTIHKHLWEECGRSECLSTSIGAYERGFYLKQDHYNGINLAFLLNLRAVENLKSGTRDEAIADFVLARRVRSDVIAYTKPLIDTLEDPASRYWVIATLYEAALGSGDDRALAEWEAKAKAMNVPQWMQDTREEQGRKLKGLLQHYGELLRASNET